MNLWAPHIYTKTAGFTTANILDGAVALDFGCGDRKLPGSCGMDILPLPAVDVVHDVNNRPWPFADNSFDLVFGNHVLEHVSDVLGTLGEIHRITKPGGRVVVQVPYFRCTDAFNDPTHEHFLQQGHSIIVLKGQNLASTDTHRFCFAN